MFMQVTAAAAATGIACNNAHVRQFDALHGGGGGIFMQGALLTLTMDVIN
jgi:hypothetical protein